MLVTFWLQWSDAAIKCLALIQGLYMNLVYIQSAHTKGTLLSYCNGLCAFDPHYEFQAENANRAP